MKYWLAKSEPDTFSWDNLEKDGKAMWDGVRNFQARNNIRKMSLGDKVLFYHSGKDPGVVGIAEITKEHYPDPTAVDGDWSVVDVKPVRKLNRKVSLREIKNTVLLQNMVLVNNSRLSVQPVLPEEFATILELGQ